MVTLLNEFLDIVVINLTNKQTLYIGEPYKNEKAKNSTPQHGASIFFFYKWKLDVKRSTLSRG